MKKKMLVIAATLIVLLGCSMTVCAEPRLMENGCIFDAEFYAQQNPDVVAAFGAEEEVLFQHYVTSGKAEGRLPYLPGSEYTLSDLERVSAGTRDKEAYNQYPKIYGQDYLAQISSFDSEAIQEIPSIWAGTTDELIEAYLTGELEYEEYPVHFPETGYRSYYEKIYNFTVTGKVISCHRYDGFVANFGAYLPTINLSLENSYGLDFRLVVEPDIPFKVGETITMKGWTSGYTNGKIWDVNKLGVQLICGARNTPVYEW